MLKLTNELINSYEKLVYSIIVKYSTETNKDDLFQAGMYGIIKASLNYKDDSGIKFTTFAYKYILGEVLKFLREDRNIRISRDLISDYKKINNTKEYMYKTYGRIINNEELSKIIGFSENRIREVIESNEKEISLNEIIGDDEKNTIEDVISIKNHDITNTISLKEAYDSLDEKEKELIYKRYFENKTQTEIAKEDNLSQVRVYRLERKILDKMKDKMT